MCFLVWSNSRSIKIAFYFHLAHFLCTLFMWYWNVQTFCSLFQLGWVILGIKNLELFLLIDYYVVVEIIARHWLTRLDYCRVSWLFHIFNCQGRTAVAQRKLFSRIIATCACLLPTDGMLKEVKSTHIHRHCFYYSSFWKKSHTLKLKFKRKFLLLNDSCYLFLQSLT